MYTLRFVVDGQKLTLDPKCDCSWMTPGTKVPVQAEFIFSKEWKNTVKVVAFYSRLGHEYPPQLLKNGKTCIIPTEALERQFFKLKVLGQSGLMTNKLTIDQKGGTYGSS